MKPARPLNRQTALLALLLLVPIPSLTLVAKLAIEADGLGNAIYFAGKIAILALPLVFFLLVHRERPSLSPARRGGWGFGVVSGLTISGIIFLTFWLLGDQILDPAKVRGAAEHNGIATPAKYLILVTYLTLGNSILEEYVWRWFVFSRCEALMSRWKAVFASAGFFTLHHVIALKSQMGWTATLVCSLGVFLGGAIWSWSYLRYRSVWPGWVSHAIVDAAIFVIGWGLIFG